MLPRRRPRIIFVHIPKTAGTSLQLLLNKHIPNHGAPYLGGFDEYAEKEKDRDFLSGHFTYEMAFRRFPDAFFITFLRDPVARVVSQYRSLKNPASFSEDWRAVASAEIVEDMEFIWDATFEEFVFSERPHVVDHIRNLQTAFLCDPDTQGPDRLASARWNLERIQFVGLQESYDRSVRLLKRRLPLPWLALRRWKIDRANESISYDVEMSPRVSARLQALLDQDIALYAYARDLFERRISGVG
jgi:hypothetical protein